MMTKSLRILIVEDNPGDAFLCKELLLEIGLLSENIDEVSTLSEFLVSVQNNKYDVVFLDLFLPDSHGKATFDAAKSVSSSAAIIVLSGLTDHEVSVYAVQSGAQDFLVKGDFDASLLEKTIVYSIERLKHMTLLETTQRQYRDLFLKNPLPTLLIDYLSDKVVMPNQSALNFYGLEEKFITGKKIGQLMELSTKEWNKIKKVETSVLECKQYVSNKVFSIAKVYFRKIELDSVPHWLIMLEDITEKIRFEHEKTQLTNKVQDFERKKIAMELHDGIAQELTLLSLYLNQIGDSKTDKKVVDLCKRLISDTITQTRTLTYSINPPSLNEGLQNGIYAFFNRLSRIDNIEFPFEINGDEELDFDYETSYNIFRIVQEFINNSVKHSQAKVIGCKIISKKEVVNFELYDEGIGFDIENTDNRGMGLKNIHERSQAMGFKIEFASQPKKGTKMQLTIHKNEIAEMHKKQLYLSK